jgi:flagellin-like hook-associated protein FlgL
MIIGNNLSANSSMRLLADSSNKLAKSLQRLSSGSKIVSPEDDAAGLAQSFKFDSLTHRIDASLQNASNLISFLQTQDGFLQKVTKALDRMSEIAVLSQDATKTATDVSNYQSEFTELNDFINGTLQVKFNGVNLFAEKTLANVVDGEGGTFSMAGANLANVVGGGSGEFSIELSFLDDNLTEDQKNLLYAAKNRWQSIITADLSDTTYAGAAVDDLLIEVQTIAVDGVNGTLATGSTDAYRAGGSGNSTASKGTITIDSADLASMESSDTLFSVYLHELGHVLGIGTLWDTIGGPNVVTDGAFEYTGTNAVAQANQIFGTTSMSFALEDTGAVGTIRVHPEEDIFDNEVMTGYSEAGGTPQPLSKISIGFLQDMGYSVDYDEADDYTGPGTGSGPRQGLGMSSLGSITGTIQQVANLRAVVGANLARVTSIHDQLQMEKENIVQASSRIKDVDVAEESTQFARNNILIQSGTSMLAQANLLPNSVLRLLG